MPPDSSLPVPWASKSDRVVRLLAACIRAALRLRYAQEISQPDSVELARMYDLQSALKTISQRMEIHENRPDARERLPLAVAEAKLVSNPDLGNDQILEIRQATDEVHDSNQSSLSQRQAVENMLRRVRYETLVWAKDYGRFLEEITDLHRRTKSRLEALRLPPSTLLKAHSRLERLILDAIRRAEDQPLS
jgi:hypothetical protein